MLQSRCVRKGHTIDFGAYTHLGFKLTETWSGNYRLATGLLRMCHLKKEISCIAKL